MAKTEINSSETEVKKQRNSSYDNRSISALKGADRVRKRPAVIFGSDGLEGCEHSFSKFFLTLWTKLGKVLVMKSK